MNAFFSEMIVPVHAPLVFDVHFSFIFFLSFFTFCFVPVHAPLVFDVHFSFIFFIFFYILFCLLCDSAAVSSRFL